MIKYSVLALVAATSMIALFFMQPTNLESGSGKSLNLKKNKLSLHTNQKPKVVSTNTDAFKQNSWFDQDQIMPDDFYQDHHDNETNALEDHDDSFGDSIDEIEDDEHEPYFPPTVVGEYLTEHMVLTEGLGPDAEDNYQKSLEQLRLHSEEAVALLTDAYNKVEEEQYLDRWKMVDTLATINTDYSLETLSAIANSNVPDEKFPGEHGFSSKSEEMMIRRAAINGIENLAKDGNQNAEKVLLSLTKAEETNVREGAILAYLRTDSNQEARKAELRQELPEKDQWILELKELSDAQSAGPVSSKNELGRDPAVETDTAEPVKNNSLPPDGMIL